MDFKYDIQFVLPVSATGKYLQRLNDFLNYYGLYNVQNRKIKVYLLSGNEDVSGVNIPKNENIDVEFFTSKTRHLVVKTYEFFSQMTEEQALQARWTAKIDDDSFNDIDGMINLLDQNYDANDKVLIVPSPRIMYNIEPAEAFCLKKLGVFEIIQENAGHELEGCWLSWKAMQEIVKTEICKKLFEERAKHESGYTDQCLSFSARLIKTPIQMEKHFYSEVERIVNYKNVTLFGGKTVHFHPICHDKNKMLCDITKNKITSSKSENAELFENKRFIIRMKRNFYILFETEFKEFGYAIPNNVVFENWFTTKEHLKLVNHGATIATFSVKDLAEKGFATDEGIKIFAI